jgi:hypothetical protein
MCPTSLSLQLAHLSIDRLTFTSSATVNPITTTHSVWPMQPESGSPWPEEQSLTTGPDEGLIVAQPGRGPGDARLFQG